MGKYAILWLILSGIAIKQKYPLFQHPPTYILLDHFIFIPAYWSNQSLTSLAGQSQCLRQIQIDACVHPDSVNLLNFGCLSPLYQHFMF